MAEQEISQYDGKVNYLIAKPNAAAIVQEVSPLVEAAKEFQVSDIDSHRESQEREKRLRAAERAVHERFEPSRKKAQETKEEIIALRDSLTEPMKDARLIYGGKNIAYETEQQRKADEERRRLERIAKQKEEDRKIREAEQAQEDGEVAEADAILSEPVETPIIHVESKVAKVPGVSKRTNYSAECQDVIALAKFVIENPSFQNLIAANGPGLNSLARSQRENFKVPGCRLIKTPSRPIRG
jgi:hypothetical protein